MTRVAVIDIGTVTARLGVSDVAGGRVERCAKTSTICNLGEGVAETGLLSAAACERVLMCVRDYVASAREAGARAACARSRAPPETPPTPTSCSVALWRSAWSRRSSPARRRAR